MYHNKHIYIIIIVYAWSGTSNWYHVIVWSSYENPNFFFSLYLNLRGFLSEKVIILFTCSMFYVARGKMQ